MNKDLSQDYIRNFINGSVDANEIRNYVFGFLFLLVDFFMGLLIMGDPFEPIYRDVLVPPMALLHLYALWIVIAPYKRQIDALLYFGVCGLFIYVGYWVLVQKIIYSVMQLSSPMYLVASALLYLLMAIITVRWVLRRLHSGRYFETLSISNLAPTISSGIGVALGHLALGFENGKFGLAGFATALTMIAWGLLYVSILGFLRYKWARRHPELFIWDRTDEQIKQAKRQRRKGNKQKRKGV